MPTITAQKIISSATVALQDDGNITWKEPELLEYLNDAQRSIVIVVPSAYSANTVMQLSPGTKQSIPADGYRLVKPTCNMGIDGLSPGAVITEVSMDDLDRSYRNWRSAPAAAEVENFMFAVNDQKVFYVSPPQPDVDVGYVEVMYDRTPTDIVITDTITINDIYAHAIYLFILYRAHNKETEGGTSAKAKDYYSLYRQEIGAKSGKDDESDADSLM